jgi:hypothetical protein
MAITRYLHTTYNSEPDSLRSKPRGTRNNRETAGMRRPCSVAALIPAVFLLTCFSIHCSSDVLNKHIPAVSARLT